MIKSFNMATMPERVNTAVKAIDSIYDQADVIRLYLNNFDSVPEQFKRDKVEILQGRDLKSTGKLFNALNKNEYYFCVDDDFIYPDNYAEYMISKLNEHGDKIVVTLHGEILPPKSNLSFFKRGRRFGSTATRPKDMWINLIGNGVSVWNTNNFRVDYRDWKYNYMDDIYVSMEMQKQNVPGLLVKHNGDFLTSLTKEVNGTTLWAMYAEDDKTQTEIADTIVWKLLDNKLNDMNSSPSHSNVQRLRRRRKRRSR